MIQFYIASGGIIAGFLSQMFLIRLINKVRGLIEPDEDKDLVNTDLAGVSYLKTIQATLILNALMFIWSITLVIMYKELLIPILFLCIVLFTFLLHMFGIKSVANVGLRNEVRLSHILKMDTDYPKSTLDLLNRNKRLSKYIHLAVIFLNTYGMYSVFTHFNDSVIAGAILIFIILGLFFFDIKLLKQQSSLVFSEQTGNPSDDDVDKFLEENEIDEYSATEEIKAILAKSKEIESE